MERFDLTRRLFAEALGTAFLVATVVGSGIMADKLAGGNVAIALLGNTLATGAILVVLILIFAPVSGAHFNPAVTLAFFLRKEISPWIAPAYAVVQILGGIGGTALAHAMFGHAILETGIIQRAGPAQFLSEAVATFGLLATIFGTVRWRPEAVPLAVGLFISAGYWFTASTCFANPAVTIARSFTASFSGISPANVPAFIAAQCLGAAAATLTFAWLLKPTHGDAEHARERAVVSAAETPPGLAVE